MEEDPVSPDGCYLPGRATDQRDFRSLFIFGIGIGDYPTPSRSDQLDPCGHGNPVSRESGSSEIRIDYLLMVKTLLCLHSLWFSP